MTDIKDGIYSQDVKRDKPGSGKQEGARVRCIIEITQPDGNVIQVETSAEDLIPELENIDLTTRKGFMDFISMADKGMVAIKNEAGKKALEAYAREALKKTEQKPPNDR